MSAQLQRLEVSEVVSTCLCVRQEGWDRKYTNVSDIGMGSGNLNSSFNTCMANTLPTKPSLELPKLGYF